MSEQGTAVVPAEIHVDEWLEKNPDMTEVDIPRKRWLKDHPGKCGAKRRRRTTRCRNTAGFKTHHVGEGRCVWHGGASKPRTHGMYSKHTKTSLAELFKKHLERDNPLDLSEELATMRALSENYIDRYEENRDALLRWNATFTDAYKEAEERAAEAGEDPPDPMEFVGKPGAVLTIGDARMLVSEITKIVARIERIRSENAISRPELYRMVTEMARVVETHVADEDVLNAIKDAWLTIRVS